VNVLGDITGDPKDREAKVDKLIADAAAKANTPAEHKQAEQKFNKAMREILVAASFQEKGFSWKSFPNHTGHADTPGCFRCHDGKHYNDKGEAIRLQCTLCHALPEVTREKGKGSVASLVPDKAGEKQPESHQRPTSCTRTATTWGRSARSATAPRSSKASRAATSAPTLRAMAGPGRAWT